MKAKTIIAGLVDSLVGITPIIKDFEVVPNNISAIVRTFGACVPGVIEAVVTLEWGNGTEFEIVRAVCREVEYKSIGEFIGNGSNHFRVVMKNTIGGSPKRMISWVDIILNDA